MHAHVLRFRNRQCDRQSCFWALLSHSGQVTSFGPLGKRNRSPRVITNGRWWLTEKPLFLERTQPLRIFQAVEKIAVKFSMTELGHGSFDLFTSWRLPRFHRFPL